MKSGFKKSVTNAEIGDLVKQLRDTINRSYYEVAVLKKQLSPVLVHVIAIDSLLKRVKMPKGNGSQLKIYTIGNYYRVENIKYNYKFKDVAIALRSDDNVLRWLSGDCVAEEHELAIKLLPPTKGGTTRK